MISKPQQSDDIGLSWVVVPEGEENLVSSVNIVLPT
jgi:hypothetical protein